MGLISDRRNKAKKEKAENGLKVPSAGANKLLSKKGLFGGSTSHMFPISAVGASPRGGGGMPQKYPPGYYTTPAHMSSSSWSHPGQPKYHPNVNPRYQTWIAPRKQPALGQLVYIFKQNCSKLLSLSLSLSKCFFLKLLYQYYNVL
jgi:hypothetical protein